MITLNKPASFIPPPGKIRDRIYRNIPPPADMIITNMGQALSIQSGEVHVWIFNLDQPCQIHPDWERLLSGEEITRMQAYHFEKDRLHFIARRGILRQLLGQYTDMDPVGINYHTNPYGKLSLNSHPLSFNLSKNQNRIVFAFGLDSKIGVDIEQVIPLPELALMAERWFSPEEREGLSALAPEMQVDAFYHIWVQKEAFIKAHGEGLHWSLKDFSVSVDPNQPGRMVSIKGDSTEISHWKMTTEIPEACWRVAVCLRSKADLKVLWVQPNPDDFLNSLTSGKAPQIVEKY
jgi:4'-phosphopantetheinyl transferase